MNVLANVSRIRRAGNRHRRAVAVVTGALGILTLVACSNSSTPSAPTGSTAIATTTSSPTSPTSSAANQPADPKGLGVKVEVSGPSGTLTADQKAAVDTWSRYWQVTMASFNSQGGALDENLANLDAVASGEARADAVVGSSNRLKKGMFTVGAVRFGVTSVEVKGAAATIRACAHDQSYEVNSQGVTVVAAKGDTAVSGQLVKTPNGWRVSGTAKVPGGCPAGS